MPKRKIILLIIIGFLIVLGIIGFTYAYITRKPVSGNEDNTIILETIDYGRITVSFENGNNEINASLIDLTSAGVGSNNYYMLKFEINSTANVSQDIQIRWKDLTNTFCQYRDNNYECDETGTSGNFVGDDLSYQLYSCTGSQYAAVTTADDTDIASCSKISSTIDEAVPVSGTDTLHTSNNITLLANSTTYYIVRVYLKNLNIKQNYNMGDTFNATINVTFPLTLTDVILAAHPPVADNVASTYVSAASGIDFTTTNSPTNGQGLYINNKVNVLGDLTTGTVKYFRGGTYCTYTDYDIEDLNGTKCLAAGGTWANNHCSLSDSQSACETAGGTYYELKNNVMFGGYAWKIMRINSDGSIRMIYNGNSPLAKGTNAITGTVAYDQITNDEATTIDIALDILSYTGGDLKNAIDTWYGINLSSYSSYLTDSTFCNDLTYTYDGTNYSFDSYNRTASGTPSFNCGTAGTYSVANGKLSVPIATINVDEAVYSGARIFSPKGTYYLQNGYRYWTMSPAAYSFGSYSFYVWMMAFASTNNLMSSNVGNYDQGVRPVISLKPEVLVSSGSGTLDDPWIVIT